MPALSTLPMKTSSTCSAARRDCSSALRIAVAPSSTAGTSAKAPRNDPIGVRRALTMNTFSMASELVSQGANHNRFSHPLERQLM